MTKNAGRKPWLFMLLFITLFVAMVSVAAVPVQAEPQEEELDEMRAFTMPEGVEYEPEVALIQVDEDTDPDVITQVLSEIPGVVPHEVTAEEIASGIIEVEVEEGVTVEEAVNELIDNASDVTLGAQPNYVYYPMGWFTPAGLRMQLLNAFAKTVAAPEPLVIIPNRDVNEDGVASDAEDGSEGDEEDALMPEEQLDADVEDAPTPEEDLESEDAPTPEEEPGDDVGDAPASEGEEDDLGDSSDDEGEPVEEYEEAPDEPAPDAQEDDEAPTEEEQDPAAEEEGRDDSMEPKEPSDIEEEPEQETEQDREDLLEALATTVNDPRAAEQWALNDIHAFEAWDVSTCDGNVTVAIIDTGFDTSHADLAANMLTGHNATNDSTDVSPFGYGINYEHGTHVAGIVAAVANNKKGIAGTSYNAKVLPIKVFDDEGRSYTSYVVNAYNYIMDSDSNVRVVNLSLGLKRTGDLRPNDILLRDAIDEAYENGIVTVASAGNSDLGEVPYTVVPADFEHVVSVININSSHERESTSNYNATDDDLKNISAPGADILSTVPSGEYDTLSGTSMAAPCVAGVLALEFAANPDLGAADAVALLYGSTTDLGKTGWDREYGWGEVNAYNAAVSAAGVPSISKATVTLSKSAYTYTGSECKPEVTVTIRGKKLTRGVDYTLEYLNNVNAGSASVLVRGIGSYVGVKSATFTITKAPISSTAVTLGYTSATFTGDPIKPSVTVMFGSRKLVAGTDYAVAYKQNVSVGTATVVVSGRGNFSGSVSKTFTISAASISSAKVTLDPKTAVYTGSQVKPTTTVKVGSKVLSAGTDYTVMYKQNVNVGTATVVLTAKGNYSGSVSKTFTIKPASISSAKMTLDPKTKVYTGSQIKPSATVKLGSKVLAEGTDYTLSFKANVNPGRGYVTAKGKGNYTGAVTASFRIAFTDVDQGTWYYEVVHQAAELGLIHGYANDRAGSFGPNDNITRGQVATILWNMAGKQAPGKNAKTFSDVSKSDYYYDAISWASSVGIVHGYGDTGTYGPNDLVTREQLAVMIANYAKCVAHEKVTGSVSDFASMTDSADVSTWAIQSVGWCFRNGIMSGSNGEVLPRGNATRAQAAKMVVLLHDMVQREVPS